jgi:hypothetical protein
MFQHRCRCTNCFIECRGTIPLTVMSSFAPIRSRNLCQICQICHQCYATPCMIIHVMLSCNSRNAIPCGN